MRKPNKEAAVTMPIQEDRERVLAFRLASHNLARRLPSDSLIEVSSACGIQNTPPGSAALALHARVDGLTPEEVGSALVEEKTLLQVWSLRQSPYAFPTRDAAVFTTGLMPEDEEGLRFFMQGFVPVLEKVGMSATEAVELTAAALRDALDGRVLSKRELGAELAKRLPGKLGPWLEPDAFSRFGATLVRPVALQGLFCFAPRRGNEASFVRTDQWLGESLPEAESSEARAGLVRRYLRCYGPSTQEHFAEWAGIAHSQAQHSWKLFENELVETNLDDKRAWLHEEDVTDFEAPPDTKGVRLLPPHDPYLLLRDRETLLPDRSLHGNLWRHAGNPGAVLFDGRVVAIWRGRKKGPRLSVAIEPLAPLSRKKRDKIEDEAMSLAPYRGCRSVEVVFTDRAHPGY